MSKLSSVYLRNLVFGVEDGLVSTVGFLVGVSAGGLAKPELILSGSVLIFVEAFSMGVGSFLSESSAEEMDGKQKEINSISIKGAFIMFLSYIVAGFWILLPFIVLDGINSIVLSVIFAIIALSLLGLVSARLSRRSPAKRIARMTLAGGLAILLGVIVGILVG